MVCILLLRYLLIVDKPTLTVETLVELSLLLHRHANVMRSNSGKKG